MLGIRKDMFLRFCGDACQPEFVSFTPRVRVSFDEDR